LHVDVVDETAHGDAYRLVCVARITVKIVQFVGAKLRVANCLRKAVFSKKQVSDEFIIATYFAYLVLHFFQKAKAELIVIHLAQCFRFVRIGAMADIVQKAIEIDAVGDLRCDDSAFHPATSSFSREGICSQRMFEARVVGTWKNPGTGAGLSAVSEALK